MNFLLRPGLFSVALAVSFRYPNVQVLYLISGYSSIHKPQLHTAYIGEDSSILGSCIFVFFQTKKVFFLKGRPFLLENVGNYSSEDGAAKEHHLPNLHDCVQNLNFPGSTGIINLFFASKPISPQLQNTNDHVPDMELPMSC